MSRARVMEVGLAAVETLVVEMVETSAEVAEILVVEVVEILAEVAVTLAAEVVGILAVEVAEISNSEIIDPVRLQASRGRLSQ